MKTNDRPATKMNLFTDASRRSAGERKWGEGRFAAPYSYSISGFYYKGKSSLRGEVARDGCVFTAPE
jgi:hypothetical protein